MAFGAVYALTLRKISGQALDSNGRPDGLPTGTRTPIGRLGGDCSILLSYRETERILTAGEGVVSPDRLLLAVVRSGLVIN